jgi:cell division protein FtsW
LGVFFLFLILLVAQPDFGTGALLVGALLLLVFVIVQNKWVKRIYITLFSLILGVIVFSIVNAGLKVELPAAKGAFWGHVVVRINNWLNPFHDVTDRSYQIANSLYAVHKGGFDGVGYGFGTRKLYMGATVHTDFIFATIGEELGFIFATFIIVTSALLVFRLLEISYRFQSKFEKFFTLLVAFETFAMVVMNAGMAVNFLPSKGWPYPLISYGPFFVVFYIIQLGIVQYFLNRRFYEVYAPKKVKKVQRTRAVV